MKMSRPWLAALTASYRLALSHTSLSIQFARDRWEARSGWGGGAGP